MNDDDIPETKCEKNNLQEAIVKVSERFKDVEEIKGICDALNTDNGSIKLGIDIKANLTSYKHDCVIYVSETRTRRLFREFAEDLYQNKIELLSDSIEKLNKIEY